MYAPEVWEYNDEDGRRGIVEIKYINNLYYFWDSLLARFPHLLIDNCAGGGNRIDIEMLSRSVSLWRSDYYVRWDACPEVFQMPQLRIRLLASLLRRRIRTDTGRFIQLPQRIRKRDHRADLGSTRIRSGRWAPAESLLTGQRSILTNLSQVRKYLSAVIFIL